MKFLLKVILIGVLTYVLEQFMPWWSTAVASFTVSLIIKSRGINSFLAGALGVGLVWLVSAIRIDMATQSILTVKMSHMFNLENKNLLITITALVGSLVGAFSSWTGHNFRSLFERSRKRGGYYS